MADRTRRNALDQGGPWFVDTTCIDCDVARQVAPGLILEDDQGLSYFAREPKTADDVRDAWRAILACPTGSIGAPPGLQVPSAIYPYEVAPGVFLAGYHSGDSFGAHAYFVPTPEGNFLVDSPRLVPALVRAFRERGGLAHILLTHRDDVADYQRYADEFDARVWIHRPDADAAPTASDVFDEERDIQPGLRAIPLAGHTRGSACFAWKDQFLFTGDSLAWGRRRNDLTAFRDATWYSWSVLTDSLDRLARAQRFEWVLPGHGSIGHDTADGMRRRLEALVARMRQRDVASAW